MRMIVASGVVVLIFLFDSLSSISHALELDEQLQFLEPLIGKKWVGGYVGSESSDIQIELRFEQVLGGRAVKYVRDVKALDFSGLTHFYWNPSRGEVCFISLNNRGIVEEGIVTAEAGRIVLHGNSHRSDEIIEFKTTIEINPKGTLRDTFLRMENGEWVQGHLQEFVAKD